MTAPIAQRLHNTAYVTTGGQAELERRLQEADWDPEGTFVLEHGYR